MKKQELNEFLFNTSEVVDALESKLSNLADIVELMAGHESADHLSGALWFVRDTMKEISEKMALVSNNIMEQSVEK